MQVLAVASDSPNPVPLLTFPEAIHGIIQSDLNYVAILQRAVTMNPEAVLSWDLNGEPCGTGEKPFIWQLSWEHLGANVDPMDAEPLKPDPTFSLSGGSAISLLMAGILGATALIGGICFTIIQNQSKTYLVADNRLPGQANGDVSQKEPALSNQL
ncbi:PREDICTED: immunoglobulin superfamily member 23 [Galeopterus variegatus]|uniref:immunoglobulin superfamily member 23 n=1 Tax=Galeopterus variegatus TaxID=482537 RepID=UPI0004D09BDB|nr:PREDICTED: immunoglobulin superfamily member 23 [Galeopterus variegatus]